ncbi:MAG: putative peroxiredoxin [Methanomassiliicoccales archaeon PtaU1.Bin124]|nr:MAG: putative peroxiredoxin [Methanomassiliicoccales archaeon PtaU1.Bin124]
MSEQNGQQSEMAGHIPLIGEKFPAMEVKTTLGAVRLPDDFKGKWIVLFSHPADFTPICTTEFVAFAKRHEEFESTNAQLIGLSVDQLFSHMKWIEWIEDNMHVQVPFPLIADDVGAIANRLGMIHPSRATNTVRAVFIIDPEGKIRLIIYYPQEVGRSVSEILRSLKALQFSDANHVSTPENWPNNEFLGDKVVIPPPRDFKSAMERKKRIGEDCYDWWFCTKKV